MKFSTETGHFWHQGPNQGKSTCTHSFQTLINYFLTCFRNKDGANCGKRFIKDFHRQSKTSFEFTPSKADSTFFWLWKIASQCRYRLYSMYRKLNWMVFALGSQRRKSLFNIYHSNNLLSFNIKFGVKDEFVERNRECSITEWKKWSYERGFSWRLGRLGQRVEWVELVRKIERNSFGEWPSSSPGEKAKINCRKLSSSRIGTIHG